MFKITLEIQIVSQTILDLIYKGAMKQRGLTPPVSYFPAQDVMNAILQEEVRRRRVD
jgi:hypothetical protein